MSVCKQQFQDQKQICDVLEDFFRILFCKYTNSLDRVGIQTAFGTSMMHDVVYLSRSWTPTRGDRALVIKIHESLLNLSGSHSQRCAFVNALTYVMRHCLMGASGSRMLGITVLDPDAGVSDVI